MRVSKVVGWMLTTIIIARSFFFSEFRAILGYVVETTFETSRVYVAVGRRVYKILTRIALGWARTFIRLNFNFYVQNFANSVDIFCCFDHF